MKTYGNLYPAIYDFDNLYRAYLRARLGKRHQNEVLRFEADLEGNLIQLQNELIWDEYHTGPYHAFHVYEPKKRLVAALPFRDRVVQHSLIAAIEPIWERRFIHHSYACRPGRGLHAGTAVAQQWLRDVQRTHGRVYCLKADVAKYFASIDHQVLFSILAGRIRCERTLALCKGIMDTWSPGLPIGNLTSQLWANIYLDQLDQYAKQHLRIHRYMRYMDDFIVVHHDKAYLRQCREQLEAFLADTLKLRLNHKTQIFPVAHRHGRGLDYLGYRIWPDHIRLRKDSVKRMGRRMKAMATAYADGTIELQEIGQRLASWLGHAQNADSYRLIEKLVGSVVFKRGERQQDSRLP